LNGAAGAWAALLLAAGCAGGVEAPGSGSPPPDYPSAVLAHAACALEGELYVSGGWSDGEDGRGAVARAWRWAPGRPAWEPLPPMPRPRCFHGAAAAGGRLWLLGGLAAEGTWAEVDCYDLARGAWSSPTRMPTPRDRLAVGVVGGRVIAVGGMAGGVDSAAVELLDPATLRWSEGPPLPVPTHGHALAVVGDDVVVAGGSGQRRGTWILRAGATAWERGADLPAPRIFASAAVLGERVLLFGNRQQGPAAVLERDAEGRWSALPGAAPETHRSAAATLLGRAYLVGGEAPAGAWRRVWRFDPARGFVP
jgi:hypothetical protein